MAKRTTQGKGGRVIHKPKSTLSYLHIICTVIDISVQGFLIMTTTSIEANNLFNVNGLVAVITGGGTGMFIRFICL